MRYTAYEIKNLFASSFLGIDFLEEISIMESRYLENGIILFYYYEDAIKTVIKYYSLQNVQDKQIKNKIDHLNKEYEFAKRVQHHPNIVNVFRHDKIRINGTLIGLVMFMEFFPMTLKDLIKKKGRFSDSEIESFLKQIGSALETAHYKINNPIVHCDIKPANIGVCDLGRGKYQYKLMDFDVSMELDKTKSLSIVTCSSGYTPGYSSPEQVKVCLNQKGTLNNTIDIYSAGVIALQMHTGVSPLYFVKNSLNELPIHLCSRRWKMKFEKICNIEPSKRPKTIGLMFKSTSGYRVSIFLKIIAIILTLLVLALAYYLTNSF